MDSRDVLRAALRKEIEDLKCTMLVTAGEADRHELHRRINGYICESLILLDQRQQTYRAVHKLQQALEYARDVGE
jgi:hypothetical protein